MENVVLGLFEDHFGCSASKVECLPASGSARKYFRIWNGSVSYIGAYHENIQENRLFIRFSRHFHQKGLHVPEILCVSKDELTYIQDDLGSVMLLDEVEHSRLGNKLEEDTLIYYRKALKELLRFQLLGGEGLDYSDCLPRSVFDRRCILWDLNYFKYCFLRLAGVECSEEALEDDFEELTNRLCRVDLHGFMFRDFQSRNIMVKGNEVWFIDYQGGRRGALHYDVASLLYDAVVRMPDEQREELLDFYIGELQSVQQVDSKAFRAEYYHFVLIRLLQAMGAFGLRGLHEKKQHFIDSIVPGLQNVLFLFQDNKLGHEYPEIKRVCQTAYDKFI